MPATIEVIAGQTGIVGRGQSAVRVACPVTVDREIGVDGFRFSDLGPGGAAGYNAFHPAVTYNSTDKW